MIVVLIAAKMDVGRTPLTEAPPAAVLEHREIFAWNADIHTYMHPYIHSYNHIGKHALLPSYIHT